MEIRKYNKIYSLKKSKKWRNTKEDSDVFFSNVEPTLQEYNAKTLKKQKVKLLELSEKDCLKTLAPVKSTRFSVGQILYHSGEKAVVKVTKVGDNPDRVPRLSLQNVETQSLIEADSKEVYGQLSPSMWLQVELVSKEGAQMFEIKVRVEEPLQNEVLHLFEHAGIPKLGLKLFYNSTFIDPKLSILQAKNIKEGDILTAVEGLGKPSVFKRFDLSNLSNSNWCQDGCDYDAIIFIPNSDIKLMGFTTFAAKDKEKYEIEYNIKIDGTIVEEKKYIASDWEDTYFHRIKLNEPIDVSAHSKIEVGCLIATNLSTYEYIFTYSGDNGNNYEQLDNEHQNLFKLEEVPEAYNGTGINSGQFPEISYYLI